MEHYKDIITAVLETKSIHLKQATDTCIEPWKHGSDLFCCHVLIGEKNDEFTMISNVKYTQNQDGKFSVSFVNTGYKEGHLSDGEVIRLWMGDRVDTLDVSE